MQPGTKNGRVMQGREGREKGVHNSDHAMKLALVDGARHLVTHSSLPNDDDEEEGDQLVYGEKRRSVTMVQEDKNGAAAFIAVGMAAAVAWVPNKTSGRHAIVPQGGPAGYGEGNAHGKFWGKNA